MELRRGKRLPHELLQTTSGQKPSPSPQLTLPRPIAPLSKPVTRILDFDVETVAAGFAEPEYVPQKITCVAWSWIGTDVVESRICTPLGLFGEPGLRAKMLAELLNQIEQAEMLTGHNLERFDLPVINAECMRLGFDPISKALVQDTMRLYRAKGFKKGLDNILELAGGSEKKMALNWQQWQDAYDEDGWGTIRERCESDVVGHKKARLWLLEQGYLRSPRQWVGYR